MSEVAIKIRPSWKSFWASWFVIALTLMAGAFAPALFRMQTTIPPDGFTETLVPLLPMIGAGLAAVMLVKWILIPWFANRYFWVRESQKVQEVFGILKRERKTTYLHDVKTAEDQQGVWGRIFGFGDVVLYTAGSGGEDIRLKGIGKPVQWAELFDSYIRNAGGESEPARYNPEEVPGSASSQSESQELERMLIRLSDRVAKLESSHKSLEQQLSHAMGRIAAAQEANAESGAEADAEDETAQEVANPYAGEKPMFAQPQGEHAERVDQAEREGALQDGELAVDTAPGTTPESSTAPEFDSDDDLFGAPAVEATEQAIEGESQESHQAESEQQTSAPSRRSPLMRRSSKTNDSNDSDSVGLLS